MGLWDWMDKKSQKTSGKAKRAKAEGSGNSRRGDASKNQSEWLVTVAERFGIALFSYRQKQFHSLPEAERYYHRAIEQQPEGRREYLVELFEVRGRKQIRRKKDTPFKLVGSNDLTEYAKLKRTNAFSRVFTK